MNSLQTPFEITEEIEECASSHCLFPNNSADRIKCVTCLVWYHLNCLDANSLTGGASGFICVSCNDHAKEVHSAITQQQFKNQITNDAEQLYNCSICHKTIRIKKNGTAHKHNDTQNNRCPGSDVAPIPVFSNTNSALDVSGIMKKLNQSRGLVLKRIPRSSRLAASKCLLKTLDTIVIDSCNKYNWMKLLLFPHICFLKPPRAGKKQHQSLSSIINRQINIFEDQNSIEDLIQQLATYRSRRARGCKKRSSDEQRSKAISEKLNGGDVKGAVRLASSTDVVAEYTTETIDCLKAKHPKRPADFFNSTGPNNTVPLKVTMDDIIYGLKTFQHGSSGGISALRPDHLKDMTSFITAETGGQLVAKLTEIANILLEGKCPKEIRPIFFGASLFALSKKQGGIRPIAVGETIRRLTGKAILHHYGQRIPAYLTPIQLGVGVKSGAELLVHNTRDFLEKDEEGNVLVKIDYKNAFNCVRRDVILKEIEDNFPEVWEYIKCCYDEETFLAYNDTIITSSEGAQQGDALASFLFAIAIHPIIGEIASSFNKWYLDDGNFGGNWSVALQDLLQLKKSSEKIGLTFNVKKCELFILQISDSERNNIIHNFQEHFPDIQIKSPDDLYILGSPIGGNALSASLLEKIEALKSYSTQLQMLDHHESIYLLRNCFSMPKLLYLLRTAPLFEQYELLKIFDHILHETLEAITNLKLGDEAWEQATLPIKNGGLGIRTANDLALPAFIASLNSYISSQFYDDSGFSKQLFENTVAHWEIITNHHEPPKNSTKQKVWDEPLYILKRSQLLENCSSEARARIEGASCYGASDWVNTLPSSNLGLKLNNGQVRVAIGIRIGAPICQPHQCVCGTTVNVYATHALSCRRSAGRFSRHQSVNQIIKSALSSAKIPATLEPVGLSRDDGKRPDGLTLTPWSRGKSLVWDFTCVDRFAGSYSIDAVQQGALAADKAEARKLSKYQQLQSEFIVCPFAVETLGGYGSSGADFVRQLGHKLRNETGDIRSSSFLRQRIGIAVQIGNTASILGNFKFENFSDMLFTS